MPIVAGYDPNPSDNLRVEVAFTTPPDDPSPVWVDLTDRLDLSAGVTITRGRQDEFSVIQPSTMSLTLDNSDGELTAGNTGSAFYPNVLPHRKIRVSYVHPDSGAVQYRFTGYVEEWPCEWPNGGSYSQAQITAVDRLARIGAKRPMRSVIEEAILDLSPTIYYPMGEPENSTSAGNASGNADAHPLTVLQIGAGGSLEFGTATGPPTDALPAPTFTPASASNGLVLTAATPLLGAVFSLTLRANFLTSAAGPQTIARLVNRYGDYLALSVDASGYLAVTEYHSFTAWTSVALASAGVVNDGLTHDAAVVQSKVGSTITTTLYLDGVAVGSSSYSNPFLIDHRSIRVGGHNGSLFSGTISHVAAYRTALTAAEVAGIYEATSTGFEGDSSDERIARYASWAGIATAEMDLDAGSSESICFTDTTGQSVLQAMQDVAQTEGGRLFINGAGQLVFHSRSRAYDNPAAAASVDATLLGEDARFSMSTQGLVNDVTGKRPTGPEVRVLDADSIEAYGVSAQSVTLLVTSDTEVADAVNWRVQGNKDPQVRLPSARFDLYTETSGYQAQLRGLELGDRITVTGLPSQAPASEVDLVVEGYSETIGLTGWDLTANLSNFSTVQALVLDDDVYGLLDGDNRLIY